MKALVYLASGSQRRLELLQQINLSPRKIYIEVDEAINENEAAIDYVQRIALLKSCVAVEKKQKQSLPDAPIITADTIVVLQGKILGKPKNVEHAKEILRNLSGNTHQVISSVCIANSNKRLQDTRTTDVTFSELSDVEIDAYVALGESLDKAGAYGVQGAGALFVKGISGSYSNVVGLPLFETAQMLKSFGIEIL